MEVKNYYKHTDVGIIPIEWAVALLNDESILITDGAHTSPPTYSNGKPIATVENIAKGFINIESCRKISQEDFSYLIRNNCQPQKGDVLLSKDGTIGITFPILEDIDVVLLSSIAIIRPKEILNPIFLSKILSSTLFENYLARIKTGSALKRIVLKDIKKLIVPIPPLPEQQAIAEVLSDTDNLIQALEKQIEKKRLIKQGVMQKLLTPKEGWELKSFGEIFEICGGFSATREQLSDEGHCYLHYGDIHGSEGTYIDCSADYSIIPKLKIGLNKISKKSLLKDGDVVFVDASEDDEGTSRHIVIRNKKNIPFISGLHTIIARSKDGSLDLKYKSYCFQSKYIKDQFKFYAVGTKVSGVSKTSIKNINVHLPSIIEQKNIAETLESIDLEIEKIGEKLSKYKSLKQGLMQNLLTGKIRLVKS